jgi:hypothetical protein
MYIISDLSRMTDIIQSELSYMTNLYCRVMHPVAHTINAVRIKPSLVTIVQDIMFLL